MYIITTNGTQVHLTIIHKCIIIHPNVILLTQNSKIMTEIVSGFDPQKPVFELEMVNLTKNELRRFCGLFKMDIKQLKHPKTGKYILLGRIILCMIPGIILKIKKQNLEFPIEYVGRIDPSYSKNAFKENTMFICDKLIFRIQIKNSDGEEHLSRIEISRGRYITFGGLFKLSKRMF